MVWYSITEAVREIDIPDATLKRYIINYPNHIQQKKVGREYRVHVESLPVLTRIRKLHNEGHKKERVLELLESEGHPVTYTVDSEDDKGLVSINNDVSDIKKLLQLQFSHNEKIQKDMNDLKIESNASSELLMNEIKELRQQLHEANEEKSVGFLSKIFGVKK